MRGSAITPNREAAKAESWETDLDWKQRGSKHGGIFAFRVRPRVCKLLLLAHSCMSVIRVSEMQVSIVLSCQRRRSEGERHVVWLFQPWQLANKHRPVNSCWWCNVELLLTLLILPPHPASLTPSTASLPPIYKSYWVLLQTSSTGTTDSVFKSVCLCMASTPPPATLPGEFMTACFQLPSKEIPHHQVVFPTKTPLRVWELQSWLQTCWVERIRPAQSKSGLLLVCLLKL